MKGAFKKTFSSIIAEPFIFGVVLTTVLHSFVFPFLKIAHSSFNLIVGATIVGLVYLFFRFLYLKFMVKDDVSKFIDCFDIETEYDYLFMQEESLNKNKLKKNVLSNKRSTNKKSNKITV